MSEFPIKITPRCSSKLERLSKRNSRNQIQKSSDVSPEKSDQTIKESDEGSISLDIRLGRLSSSSSLSWSDEYESDVTKKIYEKLKRIDRVLRQQETFPPHYDKEEFQLWMQNFPNISIFDDKVSCDNSDVINSGNIYSRKQNKTNSIHNYKESYVFTNPEFSINKLLTHRSANNRKRHFEDMSSRHKNIFTISSKPKSLDTDKFLKIVPIRKSTERNLSTKSLKIHQASKKYAEFPQQFDSLPFIEIDEIFSENRKPSSCFKNRNNRNLKSNMEKTKDVLILPPIQLDKRSISATPSQDKPTKLFLL